MGRGVRVSVPPLEGLLAWVWAGLAGLVASWAAVQEGGGFSFFILFFFFSFIYFLLLF